jgi:hypothetical protein
MTRRTGIAVTLCALLAACGGGDDGGNAAVGKTFTYGEPTTLSPYSSEATAVDGAVGSALSIQGATATGAADALEGIEDAMESLFDDTGLAALRRATPAQRVALKSALRTAAGQRGSLVEDSSFDDPGCLVLTETSVKFNNCKTTESDSYGESSLTINGSCSLSADLQTLSWNLSVKESYSFSSGGETLTESSDLHYSGEITVTDSTIKGNVLAELNESWSAGGQSVGLGVAVAVLVDVTYDEVGCPSVVTGGTYEGKLVWTRRPSGYSAEELPNQGVLITWESCGNGSIAFSTN